MTTLSYTPGAAKRISLLKRVTLWLGELMTWLPMYIKEVKRIILEEPVTRYIIYITSIIASLIVFEVIYDGFISAKLGWMPFLSAADKELAKDFVEWFGVLYGFLLPQILVRVWEQFDEIDNIFDSESDAIKILAEDMLLLGDNFSATRTDILNKLLAYSTHVHDHYAEESKFADLVKEGDEESKKDTGAKYLREIRDQYKHIIHQSDPTKQEVTSLISELLRELNTIIDLRGDRISLSSERLYETLKLLSVVTSIVWLVPFYFLYYPESSLGIFGWLLVIAVTFLVIMILTIIDDLDNPFDGNWMVNINSWKKIIVDIKGMLGKDEPWNAKKKARQLAQRFNKLRLKYRNPISPEKVERHRLKPGQVALIPPRLNSPI